MKVLILATMEAMRMHENSKVRNLPVDSVYVVNEPLGNYKAYFAVTADVGLYEANSEVDLVIYSADYKLTEEGIEVIKNLKNQNIPFMELHTTTANGWEELFLVDDGEGILSSPEEAIVAYHRVPHARVFKVLAQEANFEDLTSIASTMSFSDKRLPPIIVGYENHNLTIDGETNKVYYYLNALDVHNSNRSNNCKHTTYKVIKEMTLMQALAELPLDKQPKVKFTEQTFVYPDEGVRVSISPDFRKKD